MLGFFLLIGCLELLDFRGGSVVICFFWVGEEFFWVGEEFFGFEFLCFLGDFFGIDLVLFFFLFEDKFL